MMRTGLVVVMILLGATLAGPPASAQTCFDQMRELPCYRKGHKCNIKFMNKTGKGSGLSKNQYGEAKTVYVEAIEGNGSRAGSKLRILAGQSKTMNLQKWNKYKFEKIKIKVPNAQMSAESDGAVELKCDEILAILRGNGNCKVFLTERNEDKINTYLQLEFTCDGGKVTGPY